MRQITPDNIPSPLIPLKDAVSKIEKEMIREALKAANGNKTRAAAMLKIDIKTLRSKIREYHIKWRFFPI